MLVRHLSKADLVELADGELVGSQLRRAQDHLRACASCADALERTRDAARVLLTTTPASPPADLRARIVARLTTQSVPEITCRQALPLVHQSLDTRLSPMDAGLLRLHLDTCPDCNVELATLGEATRTLRRLEPVPAPPGIRAATRALGRSVSLPWGARLRPAFATAAVAAVALLFALHSVPQQVGVPAETAARPAAVSLAPAPILRAAPVAPLVSSPASTAEVAPPVAARGRGTVRLWAATRSLRHRAAPAPVTVASYYPVPAAAPRTHDSTPAALRALRAVASAAARDFSPKVSMAAAGERLDTLNSEALAAFPEGAATGPVGEPTAPDATHSHGPGPTQSGTPPALARLVEGTVGAA